MPQLPWFPLDLIPPEGPRVRERGGSLESYPTPKAESCSWHRSEAKTEGQSQGESQG